MISIAVIAAGTAGILFFWSFVDGLIAGTWDKAYAEYTGHLQVRAKGFEQNLSPHLALHEDDPVLKALNARAEVAHTVRRVESEAVISTARASQTLLMAGIDPDEHYHRSQIIQKIQQGAGLDAADPRGIVIGAKLAERLQIGLGGKVVLMAQNRDGVLSGLPFRVKGIYRFKSTPLDEGSVFVNLSAAREMLGFGDEVSKVTVWIKEPRLLDIFAASVKDSADAGRYEVMTPAEVEPDFAMWPQWYYAILSVIAAVASIVIAVGIFNTFLMSVLERVREFGILTALGTSPRQIVLLILTETWMLELIGILLGVALGAAAVWGLSASGIQLTSIGEAAADQMVETHVFPRLDFGHASKSISFILIAITVSVLYPAFKVSRLKPLKAIYST